MTLFALSAGYAAQLSNGFYDPRALLWLTLSLAFCLAAALPNLKKTEFLVWRALVPTLAVALIIEMIVLLGRLRTARSLIAPTVVICVAALLQLFPFGKLRIPLIIVALATLLYAGVSIIKPTDPGEDVYTWQQDTSVALTHGRNPYEERIANRYKDTHLYAPGTVDKYGYITVALPYPPLSLLLVLPGFVLGGDIRYSHLVAVALSVLLMAMARPGRANRIGALAAMLFLLTPVVYLVLFVGWTEPLMVLTFSLLMFCVCRWPAGVPWALGLFLSSKQYAIVVLPLVILLVQDPYWWKQLRSISIKAATVVAAINLPFLFWNAREFVKAVVLLRVVPPFRTDALTYSAWIYNSTGTKLPLWIPVLVVVLAIALALWRVQRTPAGFAGAVTLVTVLCFAFSKQAFCNYYYFTIATACWSVAVARLRPDLLTLCGSVDILQHNRNERECPGQQAAGPARGTGQDSPAL